LQLGGLGYLGIRPLLQFYISLHYIRPICRMSC